MREPTPLPFFKKMVGKKFPSFFNLEEAQEIYAFCLTARWASYVVVLGKFARSEL
jgi:hypothetical protein